MIRKHPAVAAELGAAAVLLLVCCVGPCTAAEGKQDIGTPMAENAYLARTPMDALSQTRDRPLFVPERRAPVAPTPVMAPPPPLALAPPAQAVPPPAVTLLGVIRSPERGPTAVILDPATHTTKTLALGETLQEWTVTAIDSAGLALGHGGDHVTLTYPSTNGRTLDADN